MLQPITTIRRGLEIPVAGEPAQQIPEAVCFPPAVALLGADCHGLRPALAVREGERVEAGQVLFSDKDRPGVVFTAPCAATVAEIRRGAQRVFQALVLETNANAGAGPALGPAREDAELAVLDPAVVRAQLLASGLWTALRTRPYSLLPAADATPRSIFVTAIDTHPLAADPQLIIAAHADDFRRGIVALSRLARVFVAVPVTGDAPSPAAEAAAGLANVHCAAFAGPHPAGLPGTHIHYLDPASATRTVWHLHYQSCIAIGRLFASGRPWCERIVSLAGPGVVSPRLLRTLPGADLLALTAGSLHPGRQRIVSGSLLGGRAVSAQNSFLGGLHLQVSVLPEGDDREFMHYLRAGVNKHSALRVFASSLFGRRPLALTTSTQGSPRAMVPVGSYEAVMPLDILPTQLLRALIVGDTEMAQHLGCMELDEEDLALCTYVCPGKYEYGPILRDVLTRIAKEG